MGTVVIYCICRVMQDPEIGYIAMMYVIDNLVCSCRNNEELISNRTDLVSLARIEKATELVAFDAV